MTTRRKYVRCSGGYGTACKCVGRYVDDGYDVVSNIVAMGHRKTRRKLMTPRCVCTVYGVKVGKGDNQLVGGIEAQDG